MPSRRADGTLVFKVFVYGPSMSENIKVFEWITKRESKKGINKKQIPMGQVILQFVDFSLETLPNIVFQLITVTGQQGHRIKLDNLLKGMDAILFIWDSLIDQWSEVIWSLKELLRFYGDKLITDSVLKKMSGFFEEAVKFDSPYVPMVVLATKRDLEDIVEISKIREALDDAHLNHTLIYETIVDQGINIKRAFVYAARQAVLNHYKKLSDKKESMKPLSHESIDRIVKSYSEKGIQIQILRGGEWKIEDGKSVFYFKVKVKNHSEFVFTNVQIILTHIPNGLKTQVDRYVIKTLNPRSFESPSFKLLATESCVGDMIKGVVLFADHRGNQEIEEFEPFKIVYVCNLLIPKPITQEKFESNITQMKEQSIIFDCSIDPEEIEPEISAILKENNFFLVKPVDSATNQNIKKISAYAEGKYDHQDVALSITMKKMVGRTSKLIIKALSEKKEKIIDLLRDISRKCDGLKIEPEFSTEIVCDNCQNIIRVTEYMKMKNSLICEKCGFEIQL